MPPAGAGGSFSHTPGKKMVCLDVDGTIVFHDGRMSEAVKQAGRALVADGHTVVVSTGRSLPATLPVIETFGIEHGYAVCSNGGVTVRIDVSLEEGYEVLDRRVFDPAPALDALVDRLPNARYAIETSVGDFLSTERFEDMSFGLDARGVSFQEMKQAEAVRLVVNSTESTAEEFALAVQSIGLHGVTYSVGWSAWLDIAAAGVTKGSSLEALRERLQVPAEDTVAVGDGRNDIEMLGWAARGVAMGQAPQEVVDVADELTAPVEEDGLVPVLRSLLTQD
ncbi:HAD family hydrolase [Nesterenkonia jeotgali]|uniref:HAD family hydrolase n=1 Tax=Nesterenkonia jeotgali TaxID=317018 RepID=A0A0W8IIV7_9MICC|nr:HAD family hydrolase [Nesterenkonia jeotgali]